MNILATISDKALIDPPWYGDLALGMVVLIILAIPVVIMTVRDEREKSSATK